LRATRLARIVAVLAVFATAVVTAGSAIASEEPGPAAGATRDYGTPTEKDGKVCPFTDNVPVSVPAVNSPVGAPEVGLGGLSAPLPAVPSFLYGELCMSESSLDAARAGSPPAVLVLVHGITYGTWYWDLPYESDTYSAVDYITEHGYATLNIDRLGEGRSDHPASALVTNDTNAETVHQLVQKLRGGEIGDITFGHVGLVGHSYGTVTSWLETAKHNDADMVIGTGYGNRFKADAGVALFAGLQPASTVPVTANEPWAVDPGYLQPRPGSRGAPLYNVPNTDPGVQATDERLANSVTAEELGLFSIREYDGTAKNITIPTFLINGEKDVIFCGPNEIACTTSGTKDDGPEALEEKAKALQQYEAPGFGPQACLRAASIPDMGHDTNLHLNAQQTFAQIVYFADQAMGTSGENSAEYRATCADRAPTAADKLPEVGRLVPPTDLVGS
jgi:pimeloyl-ACP methyl ester carboxylesterase